MSDYTICLFHKDLRLNDNPAFKAAVEKAKKVIPLYIYDDSSKDACLPGAAQKWWLAESLKLFDQKLRDKGSRLIIRQGNTNEIIQQICETEPISCIYWNRVYTNYEKTQREKIKAYCEDKDISCNDFQGYLLFDPWEITKADGTAYKVYTPYKNALLENASRISKPTGTLDEILPCPEIKSLKVDDLNLLSKSLEWPDKLGKHWKPGESSAINRLTKFIENDIEEYHELRDFPSHDGTSKLSPYLHLGEVSPHRIWYEVNKVKELSSHSQKGYDVFLSEVIWRDFAYHVFHHFPDLRTQNYRSEFDNFKWQKDEKNYELWCKGKTGFPLVDAGMRQLWETGWMHNRVRMIVASFLTKDLLIDWREGESWFWDTLVDADSAVNAFSWQWVAGSGVDAAPYFRIFNPTTQASKFDSEGTYIKRWVSELKEVPSKYLFEPWKISKDLLTNDKYDGPIVDHKKAREEALRYYKAL